MKGIVAGFVFHNLAMPAHPSRYDKTKQMPLFSLFLAAFLTPEMIIRSGVWSIKSAGFLHCAECLAFWKEINAPICQCFLGFDAPVSCKDRNITGQLCRNAHFFGPHDHCIDCGGAVAIVFD